MGNDKDQQQLMEPDALRGSLEANLNGVVSDVLVADTCIQVWRAIGEHAEAINANNYGGLFGFLQSVLSNELNLALTRLFEPEGKYPVRSIPSTLTMLENGLHILPLKQGPNVISELGRMGVPLQELQDLDDNALKAKMVQVFRRDLPGIHKVETCNLSKALSAWKINRDKKIAHREELAPDVSLPNLSFGQASSLLNYAKHFVGAVGWGFFSVAYTVEDRYFLSKDTERIAIALKRLLRLAKVSS